MAIYQTNDYTLFLIKEKYFIDKFKTKLNKTSIVHTNGSKHTNLSIYLSIYLHNNNLKTRTNIQTEKK